MSGNGGNGDRRLSARIDRSTAGWFARNGLVAVGVALVAVGIVDVIQLVGMGAGGYAVLFLLDWLLAVVLPAVAIGLAVPGRGLGRGVPELALSPARRRSLVTGAVVAGIAGSAWNWLNWTLRGVIVAATVAHLWVGIPLVIYGLWPYLADRSSFLRRAGLIASSRARVVGRRVSGGAPAEISRHFPWLFGLLGVGLIGFGAVGGVRLSRMSLGGDASGAAIGLAVMFLTVSLFWGIGVLGLALAIGPIADSWTTATRSFVLLGAVLAIVGLFVPLLPLVPGRIAGTGFSLQVAGVELIVAGIGWHAYDRVGGR